MARWCSVGCYGAKSNDEGLGFSMKDLGRHIKIKSSKKVVCFGEILYDSVSNSSDHVLISFMKKDENYDYMKFLGSGPANVAMGIARLGGYSSIIGKIGDDDTGFDLLSLLRKSSVDCRGVIYHPFAPTSLSYNLIDKMGKELIKKSCSRNADRLMETYDLDVRQIKQASIFYYGSNTLISEPCCSAHLLAMKIARRSGSLLCYAPNIIVPLWTSAKDARKCIMNIWDQADIIKINEQELMFLTNSKDPRSDKIAMSLWHTNLKLLLISDVDTGCRYYTRNFFGRVDSFKANQVDKEGADDAFIAGLLVYMINDITIYNDETKLIKSLKFANACSAIATTRKGATISLPFMREVISFLNKQ